MRGIRTVVLPGGAYYAARMLRPPPWVPPLAWVLLGCSAPTEGPADLPLPPDAETAPGPRCRMPGTLPQGPYFADVTKEAGLAGVTGVRVAAADLDGDGLPDLIVHGLGNTRDRPPVYLKRILMNRGGHFVDATAESGFLDSRDGPGSGRLGHLSVFGDVDNDGDLDAFDGTYQDGTAMAPAAADRSEILLNDGKGHFRMADPSDPSARALPTAAAAFVDYDRDGVLDLFVGTWYARNSIEGAGNYLYRGDGQGGFADVGREQGVLRPPAGNDNGKYLLGLNRRPAYGVTACDVDNDGLPDLLVSAYGRDYNELWHNDGGRFTEIGQGTPVAADDNLDYHDNEFYRCYCKQNPGKCPPEESNPRISCAQAPWTAGFDDQPARLGGNTFSTACGDLDNDGDLDLVHAEIRHWHIGQSSDPTQILRNELAGGKLAFRRLPNDQTGLSRPHDSADWNEGDIVVGLLDFDNDGRKDIYLGSSDYPGTYGLLFHQRPDGTFEEVSRKAGVHHYHAVGFAAADIDRDGGLDLIVATSTARCGGDPLCPGTQEVRVYRNLVGAARNFVQLRLRGAGAGAANGAAIGARVTVRAGGVAQVQEVYGGYGHFGLQHDTVLHFGLGDACRIDEIEVRWPDRNGSVERFRDVVANHLVELRQGSGKASYPRVPPMP